MQEERIDLIVEQKSRAGGVSWAIIASIVVHALLITYLVRNYHPVSETSQPASTLHYVELMRQQPRSFVEAPGKKVDSAPISAAPSDANRRAGGGDPTSAIRTTRPGDGTPAYTPSQRSGDNRPAQQPRPAIQQQAQQPAQQPQQQAAAPPPDQVITGGNGIYSIKQPPAQAAAASANPGAIDWKSAIHEVGKVASLGNGRQGLDLPGTGGGEKGFFDNGEPSFETKWYDWGEYGASMVGRIRVNWYAQMPEIIRTGLKGNVVIRFTIHRDGRISDVTILKSSDVPPYDFAAKKAIELSSPLPPLPKDFPNETERVTCSFFYNMEVPSR